MSEEQNKAVVRRFFEEVWNQGKEDVVDEIFAPTVVFNGQSITREALKRGLAGRRAVFTDIHVTVEDQVAKGEKVSTDRTWRATHRGPYRGVAPTGKQVTWTQISVVRFPQGAGRGGLGGRRRDRHPSTAGRTVGVRSYVRHDDRGP